METLSKPTSNTSLTDARQGIKITVTTSTGAAGTSADKEKSWNIKRPVTLIGSRGKAHIVVRDGQVSRSHAVLVNTGAELLLADLLGEAGTFCNGKRVKLKLLEDGDVLRIGLTALRISIQKPAEAASSRRGTVAIDDPLKMPIPLRLHRVDTDENFHIDESVAIIGSRSTAQVSLEAEEIALAHSVIFATIHGIGIYNLGSSTPLKVNGKEVKASPLKHRDRLLVGKIGLMVEMAQEGNSSSTATAGVDDSVHDAPENADMHAETASPPAGMNEAEEETEVVRGNDDAESAAETFMNIGDPTEELNSFENKISALQQEFAQSWGQINEWKKKLTKEQNNLTVKEQDLDNREKEISLLSADLEKRGGDLAAMGKDFKERERELQVTQRECDKIRADLTAKESELEVRCNELSSLANDVEARQAEVDQFAEQYESQRRKMEQLKSSIDNERAAIDQDRESVEHVREELEISCSEVSDRENLLESNEKRVTEQREACDKEKLSIDEQREEIQALQVELTEYEQVLQGRFDALREREQHSHRREEIITRFSRFLEEANEAYEITVDTPVEAVESEIPELPKRESKAPNKAPPAVADVPKQAGQNMQSTIDELEVQARQMVEELPVEKPAKIKTGKPPKKQDAEMKPKKTEQPETNIVLDDLEPAVRDRFRALKRLGPNGKSDAELIDQIRAELSHGADAQRKKKAWWRG